MERETPLKPADLPDIDPRFLAAHGIVLLGIQEDRLAVSMADPDDAATIAALGFAARREIVVRAGAAPALVARSLVGRMEDAFGDRSVLAWVRVDALAQLVAAGATPAAAQARMRAAGEDGPVAIDWAGPADSWCDPAAVARQLRAELDLGLAVRRALIGPGAVLVVAMLAVGWWGLVPGIALIGFRDVPVALAAAQRTGRAVAMGVTAIDPAGLTIAERDRLVEGDGAAVAGTVWDRARLMLAAAAGQVMTAMLLMLALMAVVRLG